MNVTQHGYADDQKNIIARLNRSKVRCAASNK